MTIAVKLLLTVALIFSIAVPFGAFAAGEKTKGRYKTALAANTVMFFGTMLFAVCVLFGGTAFAAESTAAAGGISTGMSCFKKRCTSKGCKLYRKTN
jgi:V/A-type H+-transporting ATPase subunit K